MTDKIKLQDVSFRHLNGTLVFDNISIKIPSGKITAILGPSGTGKTTLLRLIGGQIKPDQGTIFFENQLIRTTNRKMLYRLRKKMGMLCQSSGLFTHLNVFENVAFPLRQHTDLPEILLHPMVLLKLQMVGLRGIHQLMPNQLSGGMMRRVALARAIALDPELIMYDEPFTGQDPISMGVLLKLIKTLNDILGITSIIVSHDVQETLSIADWVYVIANKHIIAHGTPAQILQNESKLLRQFIKGLPDGPVPFDVPTKPFIEELLQETSGAS